MLNPANMYIANKQRIESKMSIKTDTVTKAKTAPAKAVVKKTRRKK